MIHLQKIVFPEQYDTSGQLYYRSEQPLPVMGEGSLIVPRARLTFDTYCNMFSLQTWKRHTLIRNIFLDVVFKGNCTIRLYSLRVDNTAELLEEYIFNKKEPHKALIPFPETDAQALYWSLEPEDDFELHEAWYVTDTPEAEVREINLAVVFCTFKREDYIRHNVSMFAKLAVEYPEMADKVRLHIVDNGRTLVAEDFPETDVALYANPNVGGAGGFARGMLEVLDTGGATHVLLMDDDIYLLPESLFRTFTFLRLCKESFREYFIGGAMLDLLRPSMQHESVAGFSKSKLLVNLHFNLDLTDREACLRNDAPVDIRDMRMYQAWWYCAMPVQSIREYGFPYPFFVRQDDIEFSIRQSANILYLNGICVWHEPFYKKDNNFTTYLYLRNMLVFSALYPETALDYVIVWKLWIREFVQASFTANYAKAFSLAEAVEDFLRGPEFLSNPRTGEATLKKQAKNKGEIQPLATFKDEFLPDNLDTLSKAAPCGIINKILCVITLNGLLLLPSCRKGRGIALLGKKNQLKNYLLKKSVLVINPYENTAELRIISTRKFAAAFLFTVRMGLQYLLRRRSVRQCYRDKFRIMISREFWVEHLGLSDKKT